MKNLMYILGTVTIIVTSTLLMFNKIDLTTYSLLNTTVLGTLYGWYNKVIVGKQETTIENLKDEVLKLDIQNSRKDEFIQSILRNNENLKAALYEQRESEKEDSEPKVETPVEKPKRVRKPKK